MKTFTLREDITIDWMDNHRVTKRLIKKGDVVYEYPDYTYNIITSEGTACFFKGDSNQFFEIPTRLLQEKKN